MFMIGPELFLGGMPSFWRGKQNFFLFSPCLSCCGQSHDDLCVAFFPWDSKTKNVVKLFNVVLCDGGKLLLAGIVFFLDVTHPPSQVWCRNSSVFFFCFCTRFKQQTKGGGEEPYSYRMFVDLHSPLWHFTGSIPTTPRMIQESSQTTSKQPLKREKKVLLFLWKHWAFPPKKVPVLSWT